MVVAGMPLLCQTRDLGLGNSSRGALAPVFPLATAANAVRLTPNLITAANDVRLTPQDPSSGSGRSPRGGPDPQDGRSMGNRLTYLDDFSDPYYVHRDFPKLTTPQWLGEPEVDAVVVLAIDDMQDSGPYEAYLRPILDRLKAIDGRAPVSIMSNRIRPDDPHLQVWLQEGLSIEAHTWDHPCPCLAQSHFAAGLETYHKCIDVLAQIPNHRPVAFRMPCCDSMNSPSPRFYAEIFNRPSPGGNFLTLDSSVLQVFTADDPTLPREAVIRPDGQPRFEHYVPFPNFANKIENYPYPYLIGPTCWQFPCMAPSDWQAQHVQAPNNPETVRDMQVALDLAVLKQGVFGMVFHPHGWIRNDQIVELIDHAVTRYGNRVKFLTFAEVHRQMEQFLLQGQSLRAVDGRDHGVRLIDLNGDGYLDVVIANPQCQVTRIWSPDQGTWLETSFPVSLVDAAAADVSPPEQRLAIASAPGGRFGIMGGDRVLLLADRGDSLAAWEFGQGAWRLAPEWLVGLDRQPSLQVRRAGDGRDQGLRFRDLDGDGQCELLQASPETTQVWRWDGQQWEVADFALPPDVSIVDAWGRDAGLRFVDVDGDGTEDLLFSNAQRYSLHLARFSEDWQFLGWPAVAQNSLRSAGDVIPPVVREAPPGGPVNNGVWFARHTLWVQNEDTASLPDKVDRRSCDELLGDLASIPPARSPQRSLAAMQTRPELRIDLVAHEPLVMDPIAMDWGPDGRLWVVEMRDYPQGMDGRGQAGGRIKVLSDTDQDGRYDQATVFLDNIPFPTGVKVWKRGVLVTAAPDIFYAEDTNGDGQADLREVLYRGFAEGNQQHRVNGLEWGLDNWLHVANGDSGGVVQSLKTGKSVPIGGRDLRIHPASGDIVAESGMTQYGRIRDDWGHWFGCNNTYPIWHYVLSDGDLRRNPHFVPRDIRHHVSETPGAAPVYPTSRTLPRFNDFHMANRFTSACGLTIYRDQSLGPGLAGNYFVCEPVHNLVQREVMTPSGVAFTSRRADDEQEREFLSSADHWFRPVMARTGPDGALWVADMYRLVIEHPEWIPAQWQARLDLRAGQHMGRIYRVHSADRAPEPLPRLDLLNAQERVARLASDNGWIRDMAHQLLLWEPDPAANPALEQAVAQSPSPLGRLHALAVLDGLGALSDDLLARACGDVHPGVRRHAWRLAGRRIDDSTVCRDALLTQLSQEADPTVLLQAALAVGDTRDADFAARVTTAVVRLAADPHIATALISSLRAENVEAILESLVSHWPNDRSPAEHDGVATVFNAGLKFVAATHDTRRLEILLTGLLTAAEPSPTSGLVGRLQARCQSTSGQPTWRLEALAELLEALTVEQREALPEQLRQELSQMGGLIDAALADSTADIAWQSAAVRLLAQDFLVPADSRRRLQQLLQPQIAPAVQQAAVRGLMRFDDPQVADALLENWASHPPRLRTQIMDAIFSRNPWIKQLLLAIQANKIPLAHLDASRRQQLMQHRNASIRRLAAEVLASAINPNRQQLIEHYLAVGQQSADTERGRLVFAQHCSACHRLNGSGHAVGPDLAAFIDKSDAGLLTAILDPNRAIEDRYLEYLALGFDGRQHRGLIAQETSNSLTLVAQEGKSTELLRSEIEQLATTGLSLMPEGLEKDIPIPAMADLLQYLRSTVPPPKEFPGNSPDYPFVRDDGSLRLLATNGRIYGPTLVFEASYRNLGFWGSAEDRAVWTLRVPRSGRYGITLDYACAPETAGNRFLLQVAGQTVGGMVAGTGSWDQYEWKDIGFVQLEAGECELVFRSDGPPNGFLMDLRGIVLWPE
jgi:putative membrane-bound dehydrogenase-like protein